MFTLPAKVESDPSVEVIEAGAAFFRNRGGVGGMDAAKALAVVVFKTVT